MRPSLPTRAVASLALAAVLAAGSMLAGDAKAAPITANYVFGDSLSDTGNLADALGHNFPTPPFYRDSFTNGPVAVQVLAQNLGLQANPSLYPTGFADTYGLGLTPGTNYAVAGATAGNASGQGVPGGNLPTQVGAFLARNGNAAPSSALYTVFIGGNDVRTAARGDATLVAQGVATELAAIRSLIGAGATNFLVVNVPDIGAIPEFALGSPSLVPTATAGSRAYNAGLASGLSAIVAMDGEATIKLFDLFSYQKAFVANAASYGITDTTNPCYVSYGGVTNNNPLVVNPACGPIDPGTNQAANIGQFAFWDAIHPTAKFDNALGNALYAYELSGPTVVAEPTSLALLGTGLLGLGLARCRRKAG